jgi:cytoskeletal protein RodZ
MLYKLKILTRGDEYMNQRKQKDKRKEQIITWTIIAIFAFIVLGIGAGFWMFSRQWNYNHSYKNMVKQTIREMVKEEALKEQP